MGFFSIFSSGGHFCSAEQNHFSNFGKRVLEKHFGEIILKSGPWPRGRCCLKIFFLFFFFFFLLWMPFCSAERHHFSNFGRGSFKKHSCKIISKSINRFRRCLLSKLLTDA